MSMTLGRIGVTAANGGDGDTLAGPGNVTRNGSTITVTGTIYGSTLASSLWQARQIAGLTNDDEPVIPVTFSDASELDGYYRVLSAAADYQMVGSTVYEALIPWQVELEQIQDFRLPRVEFATIYGLLSNGVGITTYDLAWGLPATTVDYYPAGGGDRTSRSVGDGGSAQVLYLSGLTTVGPTSGTARLVVAPASAYHAAARVEWDIASGTYRSVTGRASWPQAGDVRVSNGLVRAEWAAATSSTLTVSWWDGTSWSTATNFTIASSSPSLTFTANSARVVRNTPEQVVVRFTTASSDPAYGAATLDLMIRRGTRWVTIYAQSVTNMVWVCGFTTSTATTAITGGLRRTSNNGSGDRELIVNRLANTANHTTGTITVNAGATTALYGIGCEINGSSASGRDVNGEQRDEWYGLYEERGIVVAN